MLVTNPVLVHPACQISQRPAVVWDFSEKTLEDGES
jgi:hypothetical protein